MESTNDTAKVLDTESVQSLSLKLILAIQEKNEDEIRKLIAAGADLAYLYNGKTPIEIAVDNVLLHKCIEIITSCKSTDEKDTYCYNNALYQILSHNGYWNSKIICSLLRAGARPDNKIHTLSSLLFRAVKEKDVELIKVLIACGVDLSIKNNVGHTAMTVAALKSCWQCVEAIASNKPADTDDTYDYGVSLLWAVNRRQISTVKILLNAGATTDRHFTDTGDNALHTAIRNNDVEMLKVLLEYHLDLSYLNLKKQTPMLLAASLGNWACVDAIAKSVKTDEKDSYQFHGALLAAVSSGCTNTFTMLLDANAPGTGKYNNKPLIQVAIESKNKDVIPKLIKNGANLADINLEKQTVMDYAVSVGAWDYVSLIAENKNTDAVDSYHYGAALIAAVKNNDLGVAKSLLLAGALNNSKNDRQLDKILFSTISHEMVLLLIEHGANMSALNDQGHTPIQQAALDQLWDLVTKMARAKTTDAADSCRYGAALISAVEYDQYDAASALVAAGSSKRWRASGSHRYPLHYAALKNTSKMLELLLHHDFDLECKNADGDTPIVLAAKNGMWGRVTEIMNHKQTNDDDSYQFGKAALIALKSNAHRDDIKRFIQAGVCKNASNAANLLVESVRIGYLDCASDLLEAGADINCVTLPGQRTVLHTAVKNNNQTALRFALENGARQSIYSNGRTALEYAIDLKYSNCARILLEFDHHDGNDKQFIADAHYEQALLLAIQTGNETIVKMLLDRHAPFDKVDSEHGNIALYWAVKRYKTNPEILLLLLDHGADLAARNKDGKTIADMAREWGFHDCLKTIKLYEGYIRPNKKVSEYRSEAEALFLEMGDVPVAPEVIPEKIVRLSEYSRAILECDLKTLMQRREEMSQQKANTVSQLLDVTDPVSDREKINTTIRAIQSLLAHPHDPPPAFTTRNEDREEAKDIADFLYRKGAMDGYIRNVKHYLLRLEHTINSTHWLKYRPFFKDYAEGTPKHVLKMKAQLKKLKALNTRDEIFEIYAEVRKILMNVPKKDTRHDSTTAIYRDQLQKINAIRFIEEKKEHRAEVSVMSLTQTVKDVVEDISQKMPANYAPVYPQIDLQLGNIKFHDMPFSIPVSSLAYPVIEKQTVIDSGKIVPAALPSGDLIDFSMMSEQPVVVPPTVEMSVEAEKEFVLPDVPIHGIARRVSQSDLYKQPEKRTEQTVHSAPRKQLLPA